MKAHTLFLVFVFLTALPQFALSQESERIYDKAYRLPDKLFGQIDKRSDRMQEKLVKESQKYLSRLAKQENKLKGQLQQKDSSLAEELFGDVNNRYGTLASNLENGFTYEN